ncbi:related to YHC3-protein involved in vacuolar arginine transport [Sporisorium reilianum SRZ2]|uniref:Protein BTN n=1 Tax=Sporisorium reilianum (strain SRZ2) TaxID=999809 RepID=E6ZRG9_SPORE|nr:related to YHC3-protein involved in vacuolar arginine transport [Sporisorium reilianum SRZ2]
MVAIEAVPLRRIEASSSSPPSNMMTGPSPAVTSRRLAPLRPSLPPPKSTSYRLNSTFFLFGLLNNSLYVVILTAALELLPQGVPTGLVSFANIFPALIAKAVWPYMLRGEVRYTRRVWSCAALSFGGMLLVSFFPALGMRLAGISLASFSSGLGELTFLQLSTRYKVFAGDAVGWFASGTGAAGLVGAAAWWVVRPLGVQTGMAILSVLPGFMVLAYTVVLPSVEQLVGGAAGKGAEYAPVSTEDDAEVEAEEAAAENDDDADDVHAPTSSLTPNVRVRLTFNEKMALLTPMLLPYIIPLVIVYAMEYTINQGIAPTLIYPLPTRATHPLLSLVIHKLTDYYPLYQLVYQTFVFLSRSSISMFGLPPIPRRWLWAPAVLQTGILAVLMTESVYGWFRASIASPLVIVLVCVEGLAGGGAYVSVFWSIGVDEREDGIALPSEERDADADAEDQEYRLAKKAQEHEFRIGCVGFGDSLGILAASLISMPLQVSLCNTQVRSGRDLCKQT